MVSGVFGVLAGCFIARALHYKKKWKDLKVEYDKRCLELIKALEEVGRVKLRNKSLDEENECLDTRVREYDHLMTAGCRNLKVREYIIPDIPELPKYSIAVEGQSTRNPELSFVVKGFTANNEEDRDFAIREAEELIETINKF